MNDSELVVEGPDDEHVCYQLLVKHGIDLKDMRPSFKISNAGGDIGVLRLVNQAELAIGRNIGFVIDADNSFENRVKSICDRLRNFATVDEDSFLTNGYCIARRNDTENNIGVWVMPGKSCDGKLEDFLLDLIPDENTMIQVAKDAVETANMKGAEFAKKDEIKALIHVWLGLQVEPGKPMGMAIKCKYFDATAGNSQEFVSWFRSVFVIAE